MWFRFALLVQGNFCYFNLVNIVPFSPTFTINQQNKHAFGLICGQYCLVFLHDLLLTALLAGKQLYKNHMSVPFRTPCAHNHSVPFMGKGCSGPMSLLLWKCTFSFIFFPSDCFLMMKMNYVLLSLIACMELCSHFDTHRACLLCHNHNWSWWNSIYLGLRTHNLLVLLQISLIGTSGISGSYVELRAWWEVCRSDIRTMETPL
jgi:hypothetical protein